MKKFFEINAKSATQCAHLPYGAYNRAKTLASEHALTLTVDDRNYLTVTAKSKKSLNEFVTAFEREYEQAHAAYQTTASSPKKAETTKKTPSSTKKTGSKKLSLNDFVKANPSCTREDAKAHGFEGTRADLKALKVKLGVR